jgi:hypothetical protein
LYESAWRSLFAEMRRGSEGKKGDTDTKCAIEWQFYSSTHLYSSMGCHDSPVYRCAINFCFFPKRSFIHLASRLVFQRRMLALRLIAQATTLPASPRKRASACPCMRLSFSEFSSTRRTPNDQNVPVRDFIFQDNYELYSNA